jgi:hypothetical protein
MKETPLRCLFSFMVTVRCSELLHLNGGKPGGRTKVLGDEHVAQIIFAWRYVR